MEKHSNLNRLSVLAPATFIMIIAIFASGILFYWKRILTPVIFAGEQTKAELLMRYGAGLLEQAMTTKKRRNIEDAMLRLFLLKDPATRENLILTIEVTPVDMEPIQMTLPKNHSSPFQINETLYSESQLSLLGEVKLTYSSVFYERLLSDALTKILWFLVIMVFIVILAERLLHYLLNPLETLSNALNNIDLNKPSALPRLERKTATEILDIREALEDLLDRLITTRMAEKETREHLSNILKNMADSLMIIAPNGTIDSVNRATCELLGYNSDELIGKRIAELVQSDHKNSKDTFGYRIDPVKNTRGRLFHKNGTGIPVLLSGSPLWSENPRRITGMICMAKDVTELVEAETRINHYVQELERNNQELDEFNYVASHDLREPLRTMISYCELLKGDLEGKLNEDAEEDISFITDAANRMNHLIQDLLRLSRAGRKEMEYAEVNLNECMETVVSDLLIAIQETKATITWGSLPTITGDAIHLTRIFQNLISNAIKFHGETAPIVKISAQFKKEHWEISVTDNGIGIDPEHTEQIFSPFKRLHPRGKYEGTGIGLAIVRKIVERHGGHIWVESDLGQGSTFKFFLGQTLLEKEN